jgi:transposase
MKLHGNARTCPRSRRLLVERIEREGWSRPAAAEAAGVSGRTASKWLARWRAEGEAGLLDRSSAPHRVPHRTPERRRRLVLALRRLRLTAAEIAASLEMPLSTVSALLRRAGLGRLSRLRPPEPPNRYERRRAGELLHIDVKKLGRIARPGHRITGTRALPGYQSKAYNRGWEFVHVCVDDASRLAYVEVLADERRESAAAFLERAVAWYRARGIRVERVMTDNGNAYRSSPTHSPADDSASGTCARVPTVRVPTARPSASSRLCCANGPMPASTGTARSVSAPCRSGSGTTTTTDHTAALAASRPELGSTS